MHQATEKLIHDYYSAFNQQDMQRFLGLLTNDVVHDINQGSRETGKTVFSAFMDKMNAHYKEEIIDITVMTDASGTRAAAEFTVTGQYLSTDDGLPEANGQQYRLSAGAFFNITDGLISRVSNYYNLPDWIEQVSTQPALTK